MVDLNKPAVFFSFQLGNVKRHEEAWLQAQQLLIYKAKKYVFSKVWLIRECRRDQMK